MNSLNGGYAMIKYNSTQEELAVAYKTKRPVLFYDENHRAHWAVVEEKATESVDEETQEPITIYEYSYRLIDEASGGGKEYFHCIRYYNDNKNQAFINIKNNSSEPFTIVSLCTFLENLGCTDYTRLYVCSGMYLLDDVEEAIVGCYRQRADVLKVDTINNHEINFVYITDTVTEV